MYSLLNLFWGISWPPKKHFAFTHPPQHKKIQCFHPHQCSSGRGFLFLVRSTWLFCRHNGFPNNPEGGRPPKKKKREERNGWGGKHCCRGPRVIVPCNTWYLPPSATSGMPFTIKERRNRFPRKRKHVCSTLIYLSISFVIFQVRERSRGGLKSSKSSKGKGGDIPRDSTYSRFPGTA